MKAGSWPETSYTASANADGSMSPIQVTAADSLGDQAPKLDPNSNPPPASTPSYAVLDLGLNYSPTKVANSGQVLAGNQRWDLGFWSTLGVSGQTSTVTDMNNSGVAVGYSGYSTPYSYSSDGLGYFTNQIPQQISVTEGVTWPVGSTQGSCQMGTNIPVDNYFSFNEIKTFVDTNFDIPSDTSGTVSDLRFQMIASNGNTFGTMWDTYQGSEEEPGINGPGVLQDASNIYENGTVPLTDFTLLPGFASPYATAGSQGILIAASNAGAIIFRQAPVGSTNGPSFQLNGNVIVPTIDAGSAVMMNDEGAKAYLSKSVALLVQAGSTNALPALPQCINNRETTNGAPNWQMIGGGGLMESAVDPVTKVPNGQYSVTPLTNLPPGWSQVTPTFINDNGAIVGTSGYTPQGTNDTIPVGQHGVMLLPCQFALLNGAASGPDGADFNGNRPTTISQTSSDSSPSVISWVLGHAGVDQLGVLPACQGTPGVQTYDGYVCSIAMLAKVTGGMSSVTYGWNRTYQDLSVTISNTGTNTWYVRGAEAQPGQPPVATLGPAEPDSDNPPGTDKTVTPTNNVVAFYDAPGISFGFFTNGAPNVNDYAYEKTVFTYSLTNTIGSASAVATTQIGLTALGQRKAATGVINNDWKGVSYLMGSTNIPCCTNVTTAEIENIVYPSTNRIIFDPSVPHTQ
jgi:hypothetical protein